MKRFFLFLVLAAGLFMSAAMLQTNPTGYVTDTITNTTVTMYTGEDVKALDATFSVYADTIASFYIEGSNIPGQYLALDTLATTVAAPLTTATVANLPKYWRIRCTTAGTDVPIKAGWKFDYQD